MGAETWAEDWSDFDADFDAAKGADSPGSRGVLRAAPQTVEVRRNARIAGGVGVLSAVVAIAYLARAVTTGGALDWTLAIAMGLLAGLWLAACVDARTPLLVADTNGIRLRHGRTWQGLPWSALRHVDVLPRRGLLREGRMTVVPHNEERVLAELAASAPARMRVVRLLRGDALTVTLGLSTRVAGTDADLLESLEQVAPSEDLVRLVGPLSPESRSDDEQDDWDVLDDWDGTEDGLLDVLPVEPAASSPVIVEASATPLPLRERILGRRSEVRRDFTPAPKAALEADSDSEDADESVAEEVVELDHPSVETEPRWSDTVRPIARPGDAVEALTVGAFEVEPAQDPVIGPELAAARTRLNLSVDQLADRTRIRSHVIEAIEVDDFVPCGGDFYARGHLRTLARVLGMDSAPLLASYDERYSHAPVSPRRVFEAELATGVHGSIRTTRGGPNWSVLVAAVMALVLLWSVARLIMDDPQPLRQNTPVLNGSGGPTGAARAPAADPIPLTVRAPAGGARVVVRDSAGEIVFRGNIAAGESRELNASPPVRVQSTDGAVTVAVDGGTAKPIGDDGVAGQGTFVAD